jgi:hypothetical protein
MFKVAEGIFTDSAVVVEDLREQAERDEFLADWPRWDYVEGKWDL